MKTEPQEKIWITKVIDTGRLIKIKNPIWIKPLNIDILPYLVEIMRR